MPDGVSPGQMVQVQTQSGVMQAQVPEGLLPGQKFLIQLAPQPQTMSDAAPEFIQSATFAGPKPGYAFKSGAQGAGYYLLHDAGQSHLQHQLCRTRKWLQTVCTASRTCTVRGVVVRTG